MVDVYLKTKPWWFFKLTACDSRQRFDRTCAFMPNILMRPRSFVSSMNHHCLISDKQTRTSLAEHGLYERGKWLQFSIDFDVFKLWFSVCNHQVQPIAWYYSVNALLVKLLKKKNVKMFVWLCQFKLTAARAIRLVLCSRQYCLAGLLYMICSAWFRPMIL